MLIKDVILSASSINLWLECKLKFKLLKLDELKTSQTNIRGDLGNAIHKTLQRYVGTNLTELGQLIETYNNVCKENAPSSFEIFEEGKTILKNYYTNRLVNKKFNVLEKEKNFNITVNGVPVRGYIDRIDKLDEKSIEVTDYKSGRWPLTSEQARTDIQLGIYCLAAKESYPWAENVKLTLDFMRFNPAISADRSAEDLESLKEYIANIYSQIQNEKDFLPVITTYCSLCEVKDNCSGYSTALEKNYNFIPELKDADLMMIWAERTALEARSKIEQTRISTIDEQLKKYVESFGNLKMGDKELYLQPSFRSEYDPDKTQSILSKYGLWSSAATKITKEKLVKIIGKNVVVWKDLNENAMRTVVGESSLKMRKMGKELKAADISDVESLGF